MNRTTSTDHVVNTAKVLRQSGFRVSIFNGCVLVSLYRPMNYREVLRVLWGKVPTGGMSFSRTINGGVVIRFS